VSDNLDILKDLLESREGESLEFKEAKNKFNFEELCEYISAISNMGGGKLILGVTDKRPRVVVGTSVYSQPERTLARVLEQIPLRVTFDEIFDANGLRVLVFNVPARPAGIPIKYNGRYWTRSGDRLLKMDEAQLKEIFSEIEEDFSAKICVGAGISDLDKESINSFRGLWIKKSKNQMISNHSDEQLLVDAEVLSSEGLSYAALILFGTRQSLGKYLPNAEITFEYRGSEASGPANERKEFRKGLFGCFDELWEIINKRNNLQHYQEGLFIYDIPTFDENSIREAILNAVCHRDYRMAGNIFIRQYPNRLEIVSPGGLPPQITFENILDRQYPRNRRLADMLLKCGLVERSGQGMNLIFEEAIRHSKPAPDFSQTDKFQFSLSLNGIIQNPSFLKFLEKVGQEQSKNFSTQDWLILGAVSRDEKIPDHFKSRLPHLISLGILERRGRGKLLLSKKYYSFVGKRGVYTRKKGLDRDHNRALLLKHIIDNKKEGSPLKDLSEVLPNLTINQIQSILKKLKADNEIYNSGNTRSAKWFPVEAITSENLDET
jgi:ATP-dependent DNA helicase RecG